MTDTDTNTNTELKNFITEWREDSNGCSKVFQKLKTHLERHEEIAFDFVSRPGVTYSLRPSRNGQKERPLFAMIDVIDEDERWISVCFYEDLITDPDDLGDLVPDGLLGQDGYCFDIDADDPAMVAYLCQRLDEAYEKAAAFC